MVSKTQVNSLVTLTEEANQASRSAKKSQQRVEQVYEAVKGLYAEIMSGESKSNQVSELAASLGEQLKALETKQIKLENSVSGSSVKAEQAFKKAEEASTVSSNSTTASDKAVNSSNSNSKKIASVAKSLEELRSSVADLNVIGLESELKKTSKVVDTLLDTVTGITEKTTKLESKMLDTGLADDISDLKGYVGILQGVRRQVRALKKQVNEEV
jgi:chromosome segregation ATPase